MIFEKKSKNIDPEPSLLILGSLAISGAFESEVEMSVLEELEVSEIIHESNLLFFMIFSTYNVSLF